MLSTALLSLAFAAEPIRLTPGTHTVLKVPGLTRVAVAQEAVADVRPTGRGELLITGNQAGRTMITLWTTQGMSSRTVVVDDDSTTEVGRMVKELVNPGLRVERYNGITVIDGRLESMEEVRRLKLLVGNDASVKILATMDPRVLPAIAENITAAFRRQGLSSAHAVIYGGKVVLEGSVADEKELDKALMIARGYAGDVAFR